MSAVAIIYAVGALLMAGWVGHQTPDADRNFESLCRLLIIAACWPLLLAAGIGAALRDE
ncbi:hypothetical protein [Sphingomonas koreensis]